MVCTKAEDGSFQTIKCGPYVDEVKLGFNKNILVHDPYRIFPLTSVPKYLDYKYRNSDEDIYVLDAELHLDMWNALETDPMRNEYIKTNVVTLSNPRLLSETIKPN